MSDTMSIEEMGYVDCMRKRLGLEPHDTSKDDEIEAMTPRQRVGLICGWKHGDEGWAETYEDYYNSQGLYLADITQEEVNGLRSEVAQLREQLKELAHLRDKMKWEDPEYRRELDRRQW